MTMAGRGKANSLMKSNSRWSSSRAIRRWTDFSTTPRCPATVSGVNTVFMSLRRRVCSGGSLKATQVFR
jgi:hypothetical protein